LILSLIIGFFLTGSRSGWAAVNIINDWSGKTIENIHENFGDDAFVVVAADPSSDLLVDVINNNSFTWVIRGHSHWLPVGNQMLNNPQEAVNQWVSFLSKINKQVYFEPWNEPARRDVECGGLSLNECAERVRNYIRTLASALPANVTLTSPAWDPYHPEGPAMVQAIGNIPYSVISMHIYSPGMARNYRARLREMGVRGADSMEVILTETGALENGETGSPTYEEDKLCNMYCYQEGGKTTIDFWREQRVKYALFSLAPGGYSGSWNLWASKCVIDALKGNCHCETCKRGARKTLQAIMHQSFNRSVKKPSNRGPVSRNWFPGASTPNNVKSFVAWLFGFLSQISGGIVDFFKLPESLSWVPSDQEDAYPAEDPNVSYSIETGKIEFPQGMAEFCVPKSRVKHKIYFFPIGRSNKFTVNLLNKLSTHHYVFSGLKAFTRMTNWFTGFAYDEDLPFLDLMKDDDARKMMTRMSQLYSGFMSNYLPGEKYEEVGNEWAADYLLSAPENKPQKSGKIALFDKPLFWICEGKGVLTEKDFTKKMKDGRIDRTQAKGCTSTPIPVKVSLLFCCNPQYFADRGLNYDVDCAHVPKDWACDMVKGLEGLVYGAYGWSKMVVDRLVSYADLPIYFESCYPTSECHSYSHFFGGMTPEQRLDVSPVETSRTPGGPSNTFFVHDGNNCWACQVTKLYIPRLLGALDACARMARMALPGEIYKDLKNEHQGEKRYYFPCNNSGVKADGQTVGQANENYEGPTTPREESRWLNFISSNKVKNCKEEYDDEGIPLRCSAEITIESRDRIYVPYYNLVRQCMDFLFGVYDGNTKEEIQTALQEKNNGLDPRDTAMEASWGDIGGVSGGLDKMGRIEHWLKDALGIKGTSNLSREEGKPVYGPAGAMDPLQKIYWLQHTPGEFQEDLTNP